MFCGSADLLSNLEFHLKDLQNKRNIHQTQDKKGVSQAKNVEKSSTGIEKVVMPQEARDRTLPSRN